MDPFVLGIFRGLIDEQCEYVLEAYSGLASPYRDRVWYSLQALLTAAANISKLLWGPGDGKLEANRSDLRASLLVADDSPIKDRKVRDAFEHIDEKVEAWARKTVRRDFADKNIGQIEGLDTSDSLRGFDPQTGDVTFWDYRVNIVEIVAEARRLHAAAQRDAFMRLR